MSLGEESRRNRYLETRHYYSINRGGCESCGHRYQYSIHSTSSNNLCCGRRSSLTNKSSSRNCRGYVDISGSRSQKTTHEVDIGLRQAKISPITKLNVVYC